MKRIKEYINNHPKLKRIVKILGVVAIVFSFLFNAVIIASAIAMANNDSVKQPLVYNEITQPIKCMNKNNDRVVISIQECCTQAYYNQLTTCFNAYCDNFQGGTWQVPMYCDAYPVYYYNLQPILSTNSNNILVAYKTGTIYIMFYQHVSTNYWHIVGSLIDYSSNGNQYIEYSIDAYYTGSNIYNVPFSLFDDLTKVIKSYTLYIPYWDVESLGLVNPLYEYLGEDKEVVSEINEAYNNGVKQGTQSGYATGYDKGYLDGLEDASQGGVEANAFTLISQAFHAIADILNIQVLPHLTLGVLIFAPLIITLIIVIVKMVRG